MLRPIEKIIGKNTKCRFTYAPTTGRVTLKTRTQAEADYLTPFVDAWRLYFKGEGCQNTVRGQISLGQVKVSLKVNERNSGALPEGCATKIVMMADRFGETLIGAKKNGK